MQQHQHTSQRRGAPPGDFVRIGDGTDARRVFIGRELWYALGRPQRISPQRIGGKLWLIVDDGGYKIYAGSAMPRAWMKSAAALLPAPGRYRARIVQHALVLGRRVPERARTCRICGAELARPERQLYCSKRCKRSAEQQRRQQRRR